MTADGLHSPQSRDIDPRYQGGLARSSVVPVTSCTEYRPATPAASQLSALSVQDSQAVRVETSSHVVSIQARPAQDNNQSCYMAGSGNDNNNNIFTF